MSEMVDLRTHRGVREIAQAKWDELLGAGPPYLRWSFLTALEDTQCVQPELGWTSLPVTLERDGELLGAAPAYVKTNSEGEFVFDFSWAEFSETRLHAPYYPKLIVACPFTPATGPRLLLGDVDDGTQEELVRALASGLVLVCDKLELTGAHILFPSTAQSELFSQTEMLRRAGVQYHWRNPGYASFDDFLSRYNSKRRRQLRKERAALQDQGLELRTFTGDQLRPDIVDHAYDFYSNTVQKYGWNRQYLTRGFFEQIAATMPESILVVLAAERGSDRFVGGAFNLLGEDALYGRYWGSSHDIPYLHFNVCYYSGIDFCIERGLGTFEPGAGGEHKVARGFEPTLTHSFHHLNHPVLRGVLSDFLDKERAHVVEAVANEPSVLKPRH